MFSFSKEDIWIGYSLKDLSKVTRILLDNNISYSHKKVTHSTSDEKINLKPYRLNIRSKTQYTISVSRRDAEEAKYLINKILHESEEGFK